MMRDRSSQAASKIANLLDQSLIGMCSWLSHDPGGVMEERGMAVPTGAALHLAMERIADVVHFDANDLASRLRAEERSSRTWSYAIRFSPTGPCHHFLGGLMQKDAEDGKIEPRSALECPCLGNQRRARNL